MLSLTLSVNMSGVVYSVQLISHSMFIALIFATFTLCLFWHVNKPKLLSDERSHLPVEKRKNETQWVLLDVAVAANRGEIFLLIRLASRQHSAQRLLTTTQRLLTTTQRLLTTTQRLLTTAQRLLTTAQRLLTTAQFDDKNTEKHRQIRPTIHHQTGLA